MTKTDNAVIMQAISNIKSKWDKMQLKEDEYTEIELLPDMETVVVDESSLSGMNKKLIKLIAGEDRGIYNADEKNQVSSITFIQERGGIRGGINEAEVVIHYSFLYHRTNRRRKREEPIYLDDVSYSPYVEHPILVFYTDKSILIMPDVDCTD